MNQTIKKRIEEINNGIVPEGYEKTSFGIFPCDWEKDKSLGDICEINPKTEALPNEFIYIDLESVVDGKLIQENVIENAKAPSRAQRVLQKNDIIYQMVRPYQKNNFIFIQDDGSFKYVASTGYAQLRSDNYVFLYQMVNSEYFCTQVLKKCTGTNYPAINSQDLAEVNCAYPKDEQEQSRIAEILMQWDKAIELQEKLIEAYQKSKKYYLNKMFPKKGSNVPEIRFPGFTAPWEQRKFAEVYSFASEGGTPDTNIAAYYRNGTIPFVRIEDTENKYIDSVKTFITEEGLKHSSAWLIPSDSVIFTNGATVGNVAINRIPVATKQGILGIIPNKTVTTEYLYYLLSAEFFQREVRNRQATGTFATIILKNLNEINVFVPDKSEQQKISGYLSSIDNLITLHQQKRDKLVAQRKAMQQYLLTGIVRV